MAPIDFASRVNETRSYFETLSSALAGSWGEAFEEYLGSQRNVIRGLILIHPSWLEDRQEGLPDVRGPRRFSSGPGPQCQSLVLWGYPCTGSPMEIDHMFPYGLGGPTRADNGLTLCREHNRLKGHDIHLLPWESFNFPWLDDSIDKVHARLT